MFVSEPKTPEQLEALALEIYINDLSRRLENREYEIENSEGLPRAPSPPPEYDKFGKRTNTREQRAVKELEIERTLAVYKALEMIPNYAPPASFTRLTRCTEKYFLPVRMHPHINFIGLLLGPRGNNLRRMETESGAKISIRGRGSVKEGGKSTQQGNEEDLHCLVTAVSPQKIQRAFELIKEVVDLAVNTPEHQNDFKRLQLRQLAEMNGTLRDYEGRGFHQQTGGYRRSEGSRRQTPDARFGDTRVDTRVDAHVNTHGDAAREDYSAAEKFLSEIENEESDTPSKVSIVSPEAKSMSPEVVGTPTPPPSDPSPGMLSGPPGIAPGPPGAPAGPPGVALGPPGGPPGPPGVIAGPPGIDLGPPGVPPSGPPPALKEPKVDVNKVAIPPPPPPPPGWEPAEEKSS